MALEHIITIHHHLLFKKPSEGKKFDELFIPYRERLYNSFSRIQIFTDENQTLLYKSVLDNIEKSISEIIALSHGIPVENSSIIKFSSSQNQAYSILSNSERMNAGLLKQISKQTKIDFGLKD
ncbi:MAG: hypothetical protein V4717_12250 [Bacteroidota bacterium]